MIARLRNESGQALVMTAFFMTAMLGCVAMTIDVGAWYREHRQAQATADAAALAGAQVLPFNPSQAMTLAANYGNKNGAGIDVGGITFQRGFAPNDTLTVKVTRTSPGFFAKLFDIDSVNVHATASARAAVPAEVRWAAPIVVNKLHPKLAGPGCPCFNEDTTLPLGKDGAPGAFGMVDLDRTDNGNTGTSTLADWIEHGFSSYLPLGYYESDPGAKFSSSQVDDALTDRIGSELLFPVYDTLTGNGANAEYHVIGWAGFELDGFTAQGNNGSISGHFTRVVWDGVQSASGSGAADFGVYSLALVK